MSTTLKWRPVIYQKGKSLPSVPLKHAVATRFPDVLFKSTATSPLMLGGSEDLAWAMGLTHGCVEGAQELWDALSENDLIGVWVE